MNMCRFSGADDPGYKQVSGELGVLVERIQSKIDEEQLRKEEQDKG